MPLGRFTFFTALGAGIWTVILALIGWYFGHLTGNMTPVEMVEKGKKMISEHFIWILLFLAVFVVAYLLIQKLVMRSGSKQSESKSETGD